MDRPARSRLAPRLLLVVAVLACVFGWGHSFASAASATDHVSQRPAMAEQVVLKAEPGHAQAGHAESGHAESGHAESGGAESGHATDDASHGSTHDSTHDHSVACMASSATTAFGAVAAPVAAALVSVAAPAQVQVFEAAPPVEAHRAPSIATLCVLRT